MKREHEGKKKFSKWENKGRERRGREKRERRKKQGKEKGE